MESSICSLCFKLHTYNVNTASSDHSSDFYYVLLTMIL
jgi:hypothetical protein